MQKFPAPVVDHELIGKTVSLTTISVPFGIQTNRKVSEHHGVVKGVHTQTDSRGKSEVVVSFTDGWAGRYEVGADEATLTVHEAE